MKIITFGTPLTDKNFCTQVNLPFIDEVLFSYWYWDDSFKNDDINIVAIWKIKTLKS